MSPMFMMVLFVPFILMMWWQSRTTQKKQRDLESKLKKGDRVATTSGLIGKLAEPPEGRYVKIEIAPGVRVQMLKTSITGLDSDEGGTKPKDDGAQAGEKK